MLRQFGLAVSLAITASSVEAATLYEFSGVAAPGELKLFENLFTPPGFDVIFGASFSDNASVLVPDFLWFERYSEFDNDDNFIVGNESLTGAGCETAIVAKQLTCAFTFPADMTVYSATGYTVYTYEWSKATFDFTNAGTADLEYRVTISSVPESSSWALMLAGFAAAGLRLRRARIEGQGFNI